MRPFLIAIRFMTILPAPLGWEPTIEERGKSVAWFPLAGLLIGLFVTGLAWIGVDSSMVVGAALGVATWALLSGGLHLDGLGDCADALVGGGDDRDRTFAIMKDPHTGMAAVTAVVAVMMLKFGGVHDMVGHGQWYALVLIPAVARTVPWLLFISSPYVSPGGMGEGIDRYLTGSAMLGAMLLYAATVAVCGWHGVAIILTVLLVTFGIRSLAKRRLRGITGDVIGATIELSEAAAVVVMAFAV